jgi:hypothetical protein
MKYIEKIPNIEDYHPLYMETGWNEILALSKQELEKAVAQSFTAICVYNQSSLISFGRVV